MKTLRTSPVLRSRAKTGKAKYWRIALLSEPKIRAPGESLGDDDVHFYIQKTGGWRWECDATHARSYPVLYEG